MRQLTSRYDGECRKCGADLPTGSEVVHEKRVGVFCLGCAPTETEEIRKYRQEGADRRADRYDEWAEKREKKATAALNSYPSIRHDWAFITQPGRIPFRERMNRADDRAHESLAVARRLRGKASGLRNVRVAGDAERARQAKREKVLEWLEVGMRVDTGLLGHGTVKRINKKTATITDTGQSGTFTCPVELSWLVPADEATLERAKVRLEARREG